MNFFDFFSTKSELSENYQEIGKFETTPSKLVDTVVALSNKMGMLNPSAIKSQSSQAIKIAKRKDKYVIRLLMYTPPIEVTWTPFMNVDDLFASLNSITKNKQAIGFVNSKKLENGNSVYQFAVSNSSN